MSINPFRTLAQGIASGSRRVSRPLKTNMRYSSWLPSLGLTLFWNYVWVDPHGIIRPNLERKPSASHLMSALTAFIVNMSPLHSMPWCSSPLVTCHFPSSFTAVTRSRPMSGWACQGTTGNPSSPAVCAAFRNIVREGAFRASAGLYQYLVVKTTKATP